MLLRPCAIALYFLTIIRNVASEDEADKEVDALKRAERFFGRYYPKEYYINNFISNYLQRFNQNGQHKHRYGLVGKRLETSNKMDYFKQLNGFGFSKFGKRFTPQYFMYRLHSQKKKKPFSDICTQRTLRGFSSSDYDKRNVDKLDPISVGNLEEDNESDEELKYLTGFGFSRVGKRSRIKASSINHKNKRDAIVGIAQWGRRKRQIINTRYQIINCYFFHDNINYLH